jgi:SAM-dependent methyltransferase
MAGVVAAYLIRRLPKPVLAAALVSIGASVYFSHAYLEMLNENTRVMARSFFGALRVTERDAGEVESRVRRLIHGVIMHGEQYLDPKLLAEPTSYYARSSGIARVLAALEGAPRRIGVIGLGTGTLAAYGRKGDVVRFYEIDPHVIDIAQREFSYIRDSGARVEFALGDARLSLERDAPQGLDVLAVDAFSSDAIPVHLITREAMQVFLRHVKPGGVVAFHVTNRYLRLAPVVKLLADAEGWDARVVEDEGGDKLGSSSDWVLVTKNRALFDDPNLKDVLTAIEVPPDLPIWTDDFNNLFRVLK